MLSSWRLVSVLILCSLASLANQGRAEEPSKEETKEFLIKKMNEDRPGENGPVEKHIKFEKDTLVFVLSNYDKKGNKLGWETRVELKDLNPRRVDIKGIDGSFWLEITTTGKKKAVTRVFMGDRNDKETSKLDYYNDGPHTDERTARQLQKAFQHLITLCGGKGEPFDD